MVGEESLQTINLVVRFIHERAAVMSTRENGLQYCGPVGIKPTTSKPFNRGDAFYIKLGTNSVQKDSPFYYYSYKGHSQGPFPDRANIGNLSPRTPFGFKWRFGISNKSLK